MLQALKKFGRLGRNSDHGAAAQDTEAVVAAITVNTVNQTQTEFHAPRKDNKVADKEAPAAGTNPGLNSGSNEGVDSVCSDDESPAQHCQDDDSSEDEDQETDSLAGGGTGWQHLDMEALREVGYDATIDADSSIVCFICCCATVSMPML